MPKVNWRRAKEIKLRKPVPRKPNKVISPANIYNRKKLKKELHKLEKEYLNENK